MLLNFSPFFLFPSDGRFILPCATHSNTPPTAPLSTRLKPPTLECGAAMEGSSFHPSVAAPSPKVGGFNLVLGGRGGVLL